MPLPLPRKRPTPLDVNDLQKGTFPGDTVTVQDPPTSNGAGTDAFDEGKGIKAPPGARGEYTERPPGNYGGPGGSIGVDPTKFKVDDNNRRRRDTIPPMFLPAASKMLAENLWDEPDPKDDDNSARITEYWKDTFQKPMPSAGPVEPVIAPHTPAEPAPTTTAPAPGTGLGFKDFFSKVTRGEFGMSDVPWEPILPLEGLEDYMQAYTQSAGNFAAHIAKSIPGFQEVQLKTGNALAKTLPPGSRVLDVGASEGNWGKAISAASRGQVQTVSLDPNPDMKSTFDTRNTVPGASFVPMSFGVGFDDPQLGRVEALPARGEFDVVHESMTFQFIGPEREQHIAEMKKHLKPGGVVMLEEKVFNDAWQANEQKKDREYKSRYFKPEALAEKDKMVGFQQTKNESGAVGMLDNMVSQQVLEQSLAANFQYVVQYWDSGNFKGYAASDDETKLQRIVQGVSGTKTPFATVETPRWVTPPRRAFNVYPNTPPREMDERLLLQIPHDVQERYTSLTQRVKEYVKQLKINALDMYSFPTDPPEKWVEEERHNVQVDWNDSDAWASYLGRLSHDDVADWVGLEAMDDARLYTLAPQLHEQHALEAGPSGDSFSTWFRSRRPSIEGGLVNHLKETAKSFPDDGLGRGYSGHWRRRNHQMVRDIANTRARERYDRYNREVAYHEHVKPNYKKSFDDIVRSRSNHMPLSDVVNSLHSLPVEGEDRETVDGFRQELDGLVNEGVHALDLYRPPVSREDRMFGEMEHEGEKWVPVRRIEGCFPEGAVASPIPVPLYRYGNRYFLVHETDKGNISSEMLMIRATVFAVKPGSSILKRAHGQWERKSRALASAIREIEGGADREATFTKYGREYGPGIRKAVDDYLFVTQQHRKSDGGGGSSGSTIGDSTCSTFTEQSPDNCGGCTFNVGTGGPEFGYGDGACLLTHLFLNAPDKGIGRGDPAGYDPQHMPGRPSVQDRNRTRRTDPRLP